MYRRFKHWFSVLTLLGVLSSALFMAKPAYAFDPCSGSGSVTNNPTSSVWHATWLGSPWNVYQDQYQYILWVTNSSGHTCHLYFDINIPSTTGGWYVDDYYNYNTAKGHQPYTVFTQSARTCVWTSADHRNATCDMYVPTGGAVGLRMNWVHASPYSNQHDTATLNVWSHNDSDGSDFLLFQNTNWDVY